jgi:hypothetical protein
MIRWFRVVTAFAVFTAVAVLAGCGNDVKTADVSGTVSYDGKPVEEGAIAFVPADGKGPSGGGVIKDGKYTATKVPVGNTKVTITGSKVVGKAKADDKQPGSPEARQEYIPEKYNVKSELTFEVKSGANEKNWDLPK